MPGMNMTKAVIIMYIGIFCFIPVLRAQFLRQDSHILFWILLLEHLVMIPFSTKAFMSFLKNRHVLLSFCIASVATAGLLFFIFLCTVNGISDRGMGIIVFLIFPFVEALLAAAGGFCGVLWIIRKTRGAYRNS